MTRHQLTDEQIAAKFPQGRPGRKPGATATPVAAELDPAAVAQAHAAADTLGELAEGYGHDRDLANQILGQVQMARAFSKFSDVVGLQKLKYIKEHKIYRVMRGQKGTDMHGNEIPDVGTFEGFCRAVGTSASKVDEDLKNLDAFGEEALAQLTQAGAGYRELRQYRKLPDDQKQALIEVARAGDKDGFVELAEEIIARHTKEKEALTAQVEEAAADLEAKDRVLADRADQIQKLEEQTARKFKPRAGSEAKTLEEQNLLDALDAASMEATVTLRKLFLAADAAIEGGQREAIAQRARQAVEFAAQQLAEIATEFGITVNFEEMVRPAWLDETALDVMEARQREQSKG